MNDRAPASRRRARSRTLALPACLALVLSGCSESAREAPIRSQFGGTEPGVPALEQSEDAEGRSASEERTRRPEANIPGKDPSSSLRSQFGGTASGPNR